MLTKDYTEKDLLNKNYAILESDAEDMYEYIISLHEDYDKAKKRLEFLRKQARRDFDKGIGNYDYILVKIDDTRVKRSFNYERESE